MRSRFSSLLAGLVLAGFLVGGAVAPTLHRLHHAQQQKAAQEAAPRCAHGEHKAPAVEQGGPQITLEQCWVLARHVLEGFPPPAGQVVPLRQETALWVSVPALYTSPLEGRVVIRGPPRA